MDSVRGTRLVVFALSGTPSYVTQKEVIVGAVGFDALKEKIDQARCGAPTC